MLLVRQLGNDAACAYAWAFHIFYRKRSSSYIFFSEWYGPVKTDPGKLENGTRVQSEIIVLTRDSILSSCDCRKYTNAS